MGYVWPTNSPSASLKHHYKSQLHIGVCQLLFGLWSQLTMLPSSGFQPGFSLTAAHTALFHLALLVSRLCLVLFLLLAPLLILLNET